MIIAKKFIADSRSETVSDLIDELTPHIPPIPNINLIEFFLSPTGKIELNGSTIRINIPSKNYFFEKRDERGLRIMVMKHILMIDTFMKYGSSYLLNLLPYKKMIQKGFSADLHYYFFVYLTKMDKKIENINEFIDINIPWLVFAETDNDISDFMKKFTKKFSCPAGIKRKGERLIRLLAEWENNADKLRKHADN